VEIGNVSPSLPRDWFIFLCGSCFADEFKPVVSIGNDLGALLTSHVEWETNDRVLAMGNLGLVAGSGLLDEQ